MGGDRKSEAVSYGYESDFPKRLRALMENKNNISPLKRKVTQAELAKHLGVTRQAVSAYTLGSSIPDILKFKAIADYFKVNYGYLLGSTTALTEEHKNFAELSKLAPGTLNEILQICKNPDDAISFMLLVDAPHFSDILIAIRSYLSINVPGPCPPDKLIAIDKQVREASGGTLKAVPAKLEKDIILMNAQRYLANLMEYLDKMTEPPEHLLK